VATSDVSVRPALGSDAPALADLQLDSWREAYAGVIPDAALDAMAATRDQIEQRWRRSATSPPGPRHHVLAALAGPEVVGACAVGPADDEADLDPAVVGELLVLLVAPRRRRAGHGSRLLAAAVDQLRRDGFVRAVTWLDDADVAGGTLAGSTGWARDGSTRRLDLDGDGAVLLDQVRWHTDLTESPGLPGTTDLPRAGDEQEGAR
jgi:GNAT superfamily N-acetyltransferase